MKTLQKIEILLAGADRTANVINMNGRSGKVYPFVRDPKRGVHVREYCGFEDPAKLKQLNEEEVDIALAVMPPGWSFARAYGVEEHSDARFERMVVALRAANLRLLFNADVDAARVSFSAEDLALLEEPLEERVRACLVDAGVKVPNEVWFEEHQANATAARRAAAEGMPVETAETAPEESREKRPANKRRVR